MSKDNYIFKGRLSHLNNVNGFYVSQEERYGCALACMAMILNVPYKYVKVLWDPIYGAKSGIGDFMEVSFLFSRGFLSHTIYATEAWTQIKRTPAEWIKPFAPVHIISAVTCNGPHSLIWLKDGRVYDPNIPGIHSINNYDVKGITGYWEKCLQQNKLPI